MLPREEGLIILDERDLSKEQIDALREIGNIGAGNAATALFQLLGERIDMTVPRATLVPLGEVSQFLGGPENVIFGIFLRVFGGAPGNILFAMSEDSAYSLLNALLAKRVGPVEIGADLTPMQESALKEIGNIIAGAYLNSLSILTGLSFVPSVPALARDMASAILDAVLSMLGIMGDYALVIETEFQSAQRNITGAFFLIPDPESLKALLKAIGVWPKDE